jgi:mediator of RNA polymerase II transcription subunit 13, fungi type
VHYLLEYNETQKLYLGSMIQMALLDTHPFKTFPLSKMLLKRISLVPIRQNHRHQGPRVMWDFQVDFIFKYICSYADYTGIPIRLATPLIRVRRNDALWDMVSPSIAFWDTLGLAPSGGPKNIVSYTIYPSNSDLKSIVDQFLKELEVCYESSRLGSHTRGDSASNDLVQNGIIPWKLTSKNRSTRNEMEENLRKICISLGSLLTAKVTTGTDSKKSQSEGPYSFIVFIVNPFEDDAASIAAITTSFWRLFSTYKKGTKSSQKTWIPDVQLQIIPISFLAKTGRLVLKKPSELQAFAREVYNRCPPTSLSEDLAALPINTGWAIQLAEALPRKISFELKADPPSTIMYENSQLHVAYAQSASKNWISAAFTDNSGRYQCHASYCMAGKRSFTEVAREIWQTCLEIMQIRGVNWRLCIAKSGSMDMEELEAWANLASHQQPFSLITVLFSVDLSPPISIIPPLTMPSSPLPSAANKHVVYTPVSTPKPGVSPDPGAMTPAATPSELAASEAAHDPDAHVVDTTDDTWAVILSHRLNLQTGPLEYRQSLSSGLLIKVPPATPTQNPFNPAEIADPSKVHCICIHLLWGRNQAKSPDTQDRAWNHPSAVAKGLADGLLREFLILFRNLALLAKVRDMRDWKAGLVPWHVLVASKAVDGLDAVYGMERM